MDPIQLHRFPNTQELVKAVSAAWLRELESRQPAGRTYTVALSGGRVAVELFKNLGIEAASKPSLLDGVHFYWGDERCVPPDHTESNFRAANEFLLKPAEVKAEQIHRIPGELPPAEGASRMNAELGRMDRDGKGMPVFDLIFLGMGEDAHVASLFPQENADVRRNPAWCRPVVAVKPPPNRLTLGYSVLAAAKKVWVVASGAGKEKALSKALNQDSSTPVGELIRTRSNTDLFTDIAV